MANFQSVHGAMLREIRQECVAECAAATLPSLEPSSTISGHTAVVKHEHIHISIEGSAAGEQPCGGDEQQEQRRSPGKKRKRERKMEELEEEAIQVELKADYIKMLKKKIKFLEQQIAISSARRQASVEMEDNLTIEDIISRRMNSRRA